MMTGSEMVVYRRNGRLEKHQNVIKAINSSGLTGMFLSLDTQLQLFSVRVNVKS